MKTALVFPGQGTQVPGMGRDLVARFPAAARLMARVDQTLGLDLSGMCFDGPASRLMDPVISGLAVFAISAATLEVVRPLVQPIAFAGYSVGQYAALYAAGALDLESSLRLLRARGQCLERAALKHRSTMLSVVGLSDAAATRITEQIEGVYISNYNGPGHVSLACSVQILPRLEKALEELGVIQAVRLDVAAGWHSPFMLPAVECFREALARVEFSAWRGIVGDNVTGGLLTGRHQLPQSLLAHLHSPVRWVQVVRTLRAAGVDRFIEVGFNNQLTKFVRFIDRKAEAFSTGTVTEIEQLERLCARHETA